MPRSLVLALVLALAAAPGLARDDAAQTREAIFAGGCFWCVEADFDKVDGVLETISGYTGGHVEDPGYRQVVGGGTGHKEAVKIVYDPATVGYERLVEIFFRTVDPTDPGGQFCDRGPSYATGIFVLSERQREIAEAEKEAAAGSLGREVVTPIEEAGRFWTAETYHQNYYEKKPNRYSFYRWRCGRDGRVEELWGEDPGEVLERLG
jgi:peptide-methionine (S)-S-oxide reductase